MATYDVVVLIEQAATELDARQVMSLHEDIPDPVVYHVMMPVIDAAATVEAGIGTLGIGEVAMAPISLEAAEQIRAEERESAKRDCDGAATMFTSLGGQATSTLITGEPIGPLAEKVTAVDAREVIIMTRPHVVSEFFHLDWTSRARRKLNVPVLHLIEHENFDEQAEGLQ
ncbi:MAG: hypothetical protein NVS3B1_27860 [Marmoricola sp.]